MSGELSPIANHFFFHALQTGALRFNGPFKTNAGRESPYFFDAGLCCKDSLGLRALSEIYAETIRMSGVRHTILFGPAYKGINLVSGVGMAMAYCGISVGIAYNRKEAKDHGEGGSLVGADMNKQQVLIVDDVISAGKTTQESMQIIKRAGGTVAGVVVALDRQETMVKNGVVSERSAVDEVRASGVPVIAVATLDDFVMYLEWADPPNAKEQIAAIKGYRARYGPKEPSL